MAKKYLFVHVSHGLVTALTAILLVVVFRYGGLGRMLATTITSLVFFIYCLLSLKIKIRLSKIYLHKVLKFCWPLAAAAMLGYFFTGIDRAMLEPIHDVKNMGLYNIAVQVTTYLSLFTTALGQTFQPDVYQSIAAKNYIKTLKIVSTITVLGMFPILVFIMLAKPILSILTFGRFTAAAGFAIVLSLKNISMSLYYSICEILEGTGMTKSVLVTRIIGSIGVIALYDLLISRAGFLGAAWGQVLSFSLMSMITLIFMFLYKGRKIRQILVAIV